MMITKIQDLKVGRTYHVMRPNAILTAYHYACCKIVRRQLRNDVVIIAPYDKVRFRDYRWFTTECAALAWQELHNEGKFSRNP